MSCTYETIRCPRCSLQASVETRAEITWCTTCALYFDREGAMRPFDHLQSSSTPLYDSLRGKTIHL